MNVKFDITIERLFKVQDFPSILIGKWEPGVCNFIPFRKVTGQIATELAFNFLLVKELMPHRSLVVSD